MRHYSNEIVDKFESAVQNKTRIVISAVTYSEMRYGTIDSKIPEKVEYIIEEFVKRLDDVLPWTKKAIEKSVEIRKALSAEGIIIGKNDSSIAGHALSVDAVLVTNNIREYSRIAGLQLDNWV